MSEKKKAKQHAVVMWVIWFGLLQSVFAIQLLVGRGLPEGENVAESMAFWLWLICLLPIVVSTGIRWLVIPKQKAREKQLILMIVGLALAEAAVFFQLFLIGEGYPRNQIAILMVAVVCLIQFAPSYATPGYDHGEKES